MPSNANEPMFLEPLLGIVFDLDGTLVLSHHDFRRMRKEVVRTAERYGVMPGHLSIEEPIHRIIEKAREEIRTSGEPDAQLYRFETESHALIDRIELEALPKTIERPGATALLRGLTDRGFRLGILTRSSESFCRQALVQTQLGEFFPYLRTRSASGPAKPSPEALEMLLQEMGIPRERALYVGDHLIDAECATAARVRFYGVLPDPSDGTTMEITPSRFAAAGAAATASDLPALRRMLMVGGAPTLDGG